MLKFITSSLLILAIVEKIAGNAYCDKYGTTHSMCKTAPGSKCGSEYEQFVFNSNQIQELLKFHNDVRNKAASGTETDAKTDLPQASNMCELKWDPELAKIAQNHADQCDYAHDCNTCRKTLNSYYAVGQNIALAGASPKPTNPMEQFMRVAKLWYSSEVGLFSKSDINPYVFNYNTGHYTQLIWAKTCNVGCGGSIFLSGGFYRYYIVCNYGEAGNYSKQPVYLLGKPCSACENGGSCSSAYGSLCA